MLLNHKYLLSIWYDMIIFFPLLIQMFSVVWWNKYFHGVRRKGFSDSNRAERLSLAEVHQRAPADWVIPPSSREWQGRGLSSGRVLWCELVCAQSCMTPCDPMDCSLSGSSVHRILQARIREWVAISFSRGSSWPRDQTLIPCIGRWILYHWATRQAYHSLTLKYIKHYIANDQLKASAEVTTLIVHISRFFIKITYAAI